ncbi:MAG: hypothetical protein Q8M95_07475 [Candidatus Methanoperedens sp.]|nr:hypothetical protein [Candidatus Methanoperedens sp.]
MIITGAEEKISMDTIMRQIISETPNENPIKYVLLVLGFLSLIAAFSVAGFVNEPLYMFKVTTIVGVICGLIALPLGFKLTNVRFIIRRNPNLVVA